MYSQLTTIRTLKTFTKLSFEWSIVTPASRSLQKCKILKRFYVAKCKPKINEQVESHKLFLFRYGIT